MPNISLPESISKINSYCHRNHCLGKRFDFINALYADKRKRARQDNAMTNSETACSFRVKSLGRNSILVDCILSSVLSGHFVKFEEPVLGLVLAIDPEDNTKVCIVFEVPGTGLVPCQCDKSLLPEEIVICSEFCVHHPRRASRKNDLPLLEPLDVDSIMVKRDSELCHLLIAGPLQGHVCDSQFLHALKGGCLRRAKHSGHAYYTLDWAFCSDGNILNTKAQVIEKSNSGCLVLSSVSHSRRKEVSQSILRCGSIGLQNLLFARSHFTKKQALSRLEVAHVSNNTPSFYDRCVQTALGGSVENMKMGKLIPCSKQAVMYNQHPCGAFLAKRCGCGFKAINKKDEEVYANFFRKYCRLGGVLE